MNSSTYSPNQASAAPTNASPAVGSSSASGSFTAKTPGTPDKDDKANVVREKVSGTIASLGRSLRSLFQLKDQARRHPLATILSSAAVLLAIGGSIAVGVLEGKRRRTFSYRFKRSLRNAKRQMLKRR